MGESGPPGEGGDREGGLWPLTQHISRSLKGTQKHIRRLQEKPGSDCGAHRGSCTSLFYFGLLPLFYGACRA